MASCLRWLLRRLASADSVGPGRVAELLAAIAAERDRYSWEELEPFANRDPGVDTLVARLLRDPHESRPLAWLLGSIELDDLAPGEMPPYFAQDVRLLGGLRRLMASGSR